MFIKIERPFQLEDKDSFLGVMSLQYLAPFIALGLAEVVSGHARRTFHPNPDFIRVLAT